mgnify:FL=1
MYLSEAIRKRIENLIKENKTNGNNLALNSGIDRSTINRFLRKQNKSIKIETITLICQALNISLKDFFDDKMFDDVEVND